MKIDHRDTVAVTELANGASRYVREAAEDGRNFVVFKNSQPCAALIGLNRLEEIEDKEEDLGLMALAIARMLTDATGTRTSFDDVLAEFDVTRDELDALPEEDPSQLLLLRPDLGCLGGSL